jgi:hypothetical protein
VIRLPLLILTAAVVVGSTRNVSAEPIVLMFDVTVTQRESVDGAVIEAIDPVSFILQIPISVPAVSSWSYANPPDGGRYQASAYFGTPHVPIAPVPLGQNEPEFQDGYFMTEKTLNGTENVTYARAALKGKNPQTAGYSTLWIERFVHDTLTPDDFSQGPSINEFVALMTHGELGFYYETVEQELPAGSDSYVNVDSYIYRGTVRAVPEPSSLLLMGGGAIAFLVGRRRTRTSTR